MPQGRTETGRALLLIHPGHDMFYHSLLTIAAEDLFTCRQWLGIKKFHVIVKFFSNGNPILKRLSDGMIWLGKVNFNGLLRTMARGLEPQMLEPGIAPGAEAMHGTMQMNRRNRLMNCQNSLEYLGVFFVSGTFIMNDHIIALGPSSIGVEGQRRLGGAIVCPDDIHPNP